MEYINKDMQKRYDGTIFDKVVNNLLTEMMTSYEDPARRETIDPDPSTVQAGRRGEASKRLETLLHDDSDGTVAPEDFILYTTDIFGLDSDDYDEDNIDELIQQYEKFSGLEVIFDNGVVRLKTEEESGF